MNPWSLGMTALQSLDPETAHKLTVHALGLGVGPSFPQDRFPALRTEVAGITFPNPLGLAAGFDKNAQAIDACLWLGFGFVEAGAVTPLPQAGNDKPRVFRLLTEEAVINRYGFNNDGLDAIADRLATRAWRPGVVGINLGANKDAEDRAADYAAGAARLAPHVSFCTVNVSSPNTPGLRALQEKGALTDLLAQVREAVAGRAALFLKIAPDLGDEDKQDLVDVVGTGAADALIISNTTLARDMLSADPGQAGGLSGRPLYAPSTALLAEFARALSGRVPLVGVGGVSSAEDAWGKITSGASLVQLYTGLVYKGPRLVREILEGLDARLRAEGLGQIDEAVGLAL